MIFKNLVKEFQKVNYSLHWVKEIRMYSMTDFNTGRTFSFNSRSLVEEKLNEVTSKLQQQQEELDEIAFHKFYADMKEE